MFANWNLETNNYSLTARPFHSGYLSQIERRRYWDICAKSSTSLCEIQKNAHHTRSSEEDETPIVNRRDAVCNGSNAKRRWWSNSEKIESYIVWKFPSSPEVSLATIKRLVNHFCVLCYMLFMQRCRKKIGWVCTRPHYSQLIREVNKIKRKDWCERQLENKEQFENVIFTGMCKQWNRNVASRIYNSSVLLL